MNTETNDRFIFSAVYINTGSTFRLWFEAPSEPAAREFCARHGFGYDGPSKGPETHTAPAPVAYDEKTARALLGGISRSSLYRMLIRGELDRLAGTRRLLITRKSLERYCAKK